MTASSACRKSGAGAAARAVAAPLGCGGLGGARLLLVELHAEVLQQQRDAADGGGPLLGRDRGARRGAKQRGGEGGAHRVAAAADPGVHALHEAFASPIHTGDVVRGKIRKIHSVSMDSLGRESPERDQHLWR